MSSAKKHSREAVRERIERVGIIPAIRVSSPQDALFAAEAVSSAGIPIVEVTMTVPGALEVIRELARSKLDITVGAGSLLDLHTAEQCLEAGASFLTSTGLDLEMVEFARKQEAVVFPGALTPTEVIAGWKAGSDFIKIFPCAQVGGPHYIRALKAPYPEVRIIASGGVNQSTAGEYISAGASALGIGADLIQPRAIQNREPDWIGELARRFLHMVAEARAQRHG